MKTWEYKKSAPEPDGSLQKVTRDKIRHYRRIYLKTWYNLLYVVWITGGIGSISFSWCYHLADLKGSVGLIWLKVSDMRISIPVDLSSRSFFPLPCFIRSRRPIPLLTHSLFLFPPCSTKAAHVGCLFLRSFGFYTHHSFIVTFFYPRLSSFLS